MTQQNVTNIAEIQRQDQRRRVQDLRRGLLQTYQPLLQNATEPSIRMMARIVKELQQECRKQQIDQTVIQAEIVDRTIGDVDLRRVTECEGEAGGEDDYRLLADEFGIALPGEQLHGHTASGEAYLWLRTQMMECERLLLEDQHDVRMYDIFAVGNPLLRTWLAQEMLQWGLTIGAEQLYVGLGATDCIDKVLRGLAYWYRTQQLPSFAMLVSSPGFAMPEWLAVSHGYRLVRLSASAANRFKMTAEQLHEILQTHTDIRVIYLMITNNPTTFAYTAAELQALYAVLQRYREQGREILVLADLAYIGTGMPEEDRERMAIFQQSQVLQQTIFVSSFSKTHTLTGDRYGWVTFGEKRLADAVSVIWINCQGSLPAEWQLRYMASVRFFQQRPWLVEKLRRLYRFRRTRFVEQLHHLNSQFHLFQEVYLDDDATIYNWSQLVSGVDAFTVFEKTGIAGIPGSVFGYSDDFIRFSVGICPLS